MTTHVLEATGGMTLVEPDVKPEGIPVTEGGSIVAEGAFRRAEFAAGGRTALGTPEVPGSAIEAGAPRPLTPAFGGRTALGSGRAVALAGFEDGGSEASGGPESGLPAAILLGLGGNPPLEIPAVTDGGRAVMAEPLAGNPLFGIPAVMYGGRAVTLKGNPLFGIPAVMDGGRAVTLDGSPLPAVINGGRAVMAEPLGGIPLFEIPAVMDGGRAVRAVGMPFVAAGFNKALIAI